MRPTELGFRPREVFPLRSHESGRPVVEARIDGDTVLLYIDTGWLMPNQLAAISVDYAAEHGYRVANLSWHHATDFRPDYRLGSTTVDTLEVLGKIVADARVGVSDEASEYVDGRPVVGVVAWEFVTDGLLWLETAAGTVAYSQRLDGPLSVERQHQVLELEQVQGEYVPVTRDVKPLGLKGSPYYLLDTGSSASYARPPTVWSRMSRRVRRSLRRPERARERSFQFPDGSVRAVEVSDILTPLCPIYPFETRGMFGMDVIGQWITVWDARRGQLYLIEHEYD